MVARPAGLYDQPLTVTDGPPVRRWEATVDEEIKALADQLKAVRDLPAGLAKYGREADDRLEVAAVLARNLLEKKAAPRGFLGRLVGFDPATLYLILQLVLLVLDILKRRRQGTF